MFPEFSWLRLTRTNRPTLVAHAPRAAASAAQPPDMTEPARDIRPAPQFRAELHRALEATHRQHAAQRALGTRPQPTSHTASEERWARVAVMLALVTIGLLAFRRSMRAEGRGARPYDQTV